MLTCQDSEEAADSGRYSIIVCWEHDGLDVNLELDALLQLPLDIRILIAKKMKYCMAT